jgi:hypothetical protein
LGAAVIIPSTIILAGGPGRAQDGDTPKNREWGQLVFGQALSIGSDKEVYDAGERVVVDFRHKNFSGAGVPIHHDGPSDDEFTVVLAKSPYTRFIDDRSVPFVPPGGLIPFTLYGRLRLGPNGIPSGGGGTFRAGKERSFPIDLTRVFDMSMDGTYRITASRYVWKSRSEKPAKATSNTIEVTVRETPYIGSDVKKIRSR